MATAVSAAATACGNVLLVLGMDDSLQTHPSNMSDLVERFWAAVSSAADPMAYKPRRNPGVIVSRLETQSQPYYILKEPASKAYLRLSEADYALWWQMDGHRSLKDLLYYSLVRYASLPIGHLNRLVTDLRTGRFLHDKPVNVYRQVEGQLEAQDSAAVGRRMVDAFLHSELGVDELDPYFSRLYRWLRPLFFLPVQLFLLVAVVLGGGFLYGRLYYQQTFPLSGNGSWSLVTLLVANVVVIGIHELAHGLATKHFGRELNRGGFLLYWGMPAFFVDTRDIWLSPRRARIVVSWAGPHSGLLIGGLVGMILTAVSVQFPQFSGSIWVGFINQLGFLAYLSVFINLNPLLQLDGYFILMDWLDMPGLRSRAIRFWREKLWKSWAAVRNPWRFWASLEWSERIFTLYGGLTLVYSTYAVGFAINFWQTRLAPLVEALWTDYGIAGRLLVMLVTAFVVVPVIYYILRLGWSRVQSGLEWLARRDMLARPDVLALLVGLGYLVTLTGFFLLLSKLTRASLWLSLVIWLLHAGTAIFLGRVARHVSGSRYQWTLWSLAAAPVGLAITWLSDATWLRDLGTLITVGSILASGVVSWFTIRPMSLERGDRLLIGALALIGAIGAVGLSLRPGPLLYVPLFAWLGMIAGLALMAPLWLNFWHSRFALPWFLIVLAALSTPWVRLFPALHLPLISLWFCTSLLYLLQSELTRFGRVQQQEESTAIFHERELLVHSYSHFIRALFTSYETVMGGRRLAAIQAQMARIGPIDPDVDILQIAERCQSILLLAVDRLDDLAGVAFTRQAGQAAYDSLPWLEAETLARHVLSRDEWGSQLAHGYIEGQDSRVELIRQADVFAGFDKAAVEEVSAISYGDSWKAGALIARGGQDASRFFLIQSGEVGVMHEGSSVASLVNGAYFGLNALLDSGEYQFTYQALTPVQALVIERDRFNPLLRADTTLSARISSGAESRNLLKSMSLFRGLSPQQLATIDGRLERRLVPAGHTIVSQGQPRSQFFIVASGMIEMSREDEGGRHMVSTLGPGEHFGEYALFADIPYDATYRTLVDSKLLALDEPSFDRLVTESEMMSRYIEQIGSGRNIITRRRLGPSAVLS